MNEISNISSEKKKLSVTVKNIIRTLTFCCVILFFCPMFMVSCSDSDWGVDTDLIKVSAVTAIKMNDSPVYMFKTYPGLLWIFQPNQVSPLPLLRKAISCEWGLDREYSPDF